MIARAEARCSQAWLSSASNCSSGRVFGERESGSEGSRRVVPVVHSEQEHVKKYF